MPGVGPVTATAIIAPIGNGAAFGKGRDFAAQNVAIVALANKLARMAWAVLTKNEAYRPPLLAGASI